MTDKKPPIFGYDDRYFDDCDYTREELYALQEIVLEQIEKNPTTYKYELSKLKDDQDMIQSILFMKKIKEREIQEKKIDKS